MTSSIRRALLAGVVVLAAILAVVFTVGIATHSQTSETGGVTLTPG